MRLLSLFAGLLFTVLLCGCATPIKPPCAIEEGEISGQHAIFLNNNFLRVGIIPSSNGRIASLVYRPLDCEVMYPYKEKREGDNPLLPANISSNKSGHCEWFWNVRESTKEISDMNVKILYDNPNRAGIRLTAANYCGQNIELTRDVILERNSSEIKVHVKAKNTGKSPFPLTLCLRSIPAMSTPKNDDIYLPGLANVAEVGKIQVINLDHNKLVKVGKAEKKNCFVAPSSPWSARISHSSPLMFAYLLNKNDLMPKGIFYTWSGKKDNDFIQTQEVILNPVTIESGETHEWKYKIALFGGMFGISDIINGYAINYRYKMEQDTLRIKFKVCCAEPQEAQWLQIKIRDINDPGNGPTFGEARIMLPIMQPNKPVTVVADLTKMQEGTFRMFAEIARNGFRVVPGPIIKIKKIIRFEPEK